LLLEGREDEGLWK